MIQHFLVVLKCFTNKLLILVVDDDSNNNLQIGKWGIGEDEFVPVTEVLLFF